MDTALRTLFNGFEGRTAEQKMAVGGELDRIAGLVRDLQGYTRERIAGTKCTDPESVLDGIFSRHQ